MTGALLDGVFAVVATEAMDYKVNSGVIWKFCNYLLGTASCLMSD